MDQGTEKGRHSDRVTRRYLVSGRVQGVGFRYFVLRQAQSAGVSGWVRNLGTGQVEVSASGTEEQHAALEQALWKGPRFSQVTGVDKTEIPGELDVVSGFDIVD